MSSNPEIHFDIQLSEPYEYVSKWLDTNKHTLQQKCMGVRNLSIDVFANTAQRAIYLALEAHPRAQVHVCQRRGTTKLYFDAEKVEHLTEHSL